MPGVLSFPPASFIQPCRPIVVSKPPIGPGWAHELKHDSYRPQIHVRDGRVRLYTRNGADWTKHYPRIVEEAARLREPLIIDAEAVCLSDKGVADFDGHRRSGSSDGLSTRFPV
jgi:bifunctional non-homologous end joining protein LigD